MENGTRALLMASGILISMIIISLGVYLYTTFGNYSKNIRNELSLSEKQEFNAQFLKYETDETSYCTAYDIVSIINLAQNNNAKYDEYIIYNTSRQLVRPTNYDENNNSYIYININGNDINETTTDSKILNDFLKNNYNENEGNLTQYRCIVTVSDETGLVKSINFTKI